MPDAANPDPANLPIRGGLERELQRAWARLAAPGTWWSAAERAAIAAEVRNAQACELCRQRNEALSPYTVDGKHDSLGTLSSPMVEVVHRISTDAGGLKRSWLQSMLRKGVTEEQYVETLGVIALITALDTFDHALGREQRALPAPQSGALSLVPQEVRNFFDLDVEQYLKDHEIRDFGTEFRALTHPQIELLAGRVSALNGCYY